MNLADFTEVKQINKGWYGDQKYCVTDKSGQKYLFRVSPMEQYDRKKAEFECMQKVAALGIPMCEPVEFGTCDEGVYALQTWIEGRDAEKVLPELSDRQVYDYGVESGKLLKKIHSIPAPSDVEDWETFFNRNISFGAVGTGGWSDGDGIINCIRASYDVDDESFTVSLLKHEAQHAMDLAMIPDLSSAELEYRAKLVELIYSSERNLLTQFGYEADSSNVSNGHGVAAERIVSEFEQQSKRGRDAFGELSVEEIQVIARELFRKSNGEIL